MPQIKLARNEKIKTQNAHCGGEQVALVWWLGGDPIRFTFPFSLSAVVVKAVEYIQCQQSGAGLTVQKMTCGF